MRKGVPIAITGMASHFPSAENLFDFWSSVENKVDAITDNLDFEGYWKKSDYYEPGTKDKDKTYAHKAGWVPPIDFDPVEFKIPPAMLESICSAQLFSLYVAKQAFKDAGLFDENCKFNRERVGVILGGAGNGNTSFMLAARQQAPFLKQILSNSGLPEPVADDIVARLLDQYLEWNEDSFPGFLGNVACGRIASFFDLGGTSNMVDAACASSLAAMKAAIGELADGSCDAVLTGGVNLENSIFSFLCFSRTPALSPSNTSRPFDSKSDGMMLGDGVGLLVLKRLEDAERDGDRIYAVIQSLSGASDGRAKSIFAPRREGQVLAINRAYDIAGITAKDIELIEAHGTGTAAGDQTELKSLHTVYGDLGLDKQSVAVGSMKSQIGHTRCAAGAASAIKMALSLHHKVYPATINVKQPNKFFVEQDSPFYVNTENRPWVKAKQAGPRRGAVSAFGFGGTNYHMVMQEYQQEQTEPYRLNITPQVVILHKDSCLQLTESCQEQLTALSGDSPEQAFTELLKRQNHTALGADEARIGFVAKNAEQAAELLATAIGLLQRNGDKPWEHPRGIYYRPFATPTNGKGRVVALFPGQGSQYVDMGRRIANEYPEMRQALASMDACRTDLQQEAISRIVYPAPVFNEGDAKANQTTLTSTDNAQPAIGAVSAGYYNILKRYGFKPDFVAGHSFGELTALLAAEVIDQDQFNQLAILRGSAMKSQAEDGKDSGAMLAVNLALADVEAEIKAYDDIYLANINSGDQIVLGGGSDQINRLCEKLKNDGVRCARLPVSAAFHTRYVAHGAKPFEKGLKDFKFKRPHIPVYSNVSGCEHQVKGDAIKSALAQQLTSAVRFKETIENIYQAGGTRFVEIGPKGVLGKLVSEILGDREHTVVSLDPGQNANESESFRKALAKMIVDGIELSGQDPYAILPESKSTNKRLTFRVNGGYYFSAASQARREKANRVDTAALDDYIEQQVQAMLVTHKPGADLTETSSPTEPVFEPVSDDSLAPREQARDWTHALLLDDLNDYEELENHMTDQSKAARGQAAGLLSSQINAQNSVNQVHQQFQENQKEYVGFLQAMMNKQFEVFDKHGDSANFKDMVASLNQTLQLLEKNQTCYHLNHEKYFLNQQALMGAGVSAAPSASAISPQLAEPAIEPVTMPAPAATPAVEATNAYASIVPTVAAPAPNLPEMTSPAAMPEPTVAASPEPAPAAAASGLTEEEQKALAELENLTEEKMAKDLIKVISDKTGYPDDMIGVDMDLEADLGIDSIKRIEIIGAMFETFDSNVMPGIENAEEYLDLETVDVDQFSTINKMVEFLYGRIQAYMNSLKETAGSAVTAPEPSPVAAAPAKTPAGPVDAGVQDVMTSIGFVTSSNDVSSVKSDPVVVKADLRNTAGAISSVEETFSASAPVLLAQSLESSTPIERYRAELTEIALPDQQPLALPEGFAWLVVDDDPKLAGAVAKQLQEQQQKSIRLSLTGKDKDADFSLLELTEAAITDTLGSIEQQHGKIGGVLFLVSTSPTAKSIKASFNKKDYASVDALFLLAKHLQESLNSAAAAGDAVFMVCSQMDGQLGTSGKRVFATVTSGYSGLVKSLNYEWNGVRCKTVDLKPKLSAGDAAGVILQELQDPSSELLEVGRMSLSQRSTLSLQLAPLDFSASNSVSDADVILVSGGGRGITASCVKALAAESSASFILLGRTDIEQGQPSWVAECGDDLNALRAAAIADMQAKGEQLTPVKIDKRLNPIVQAFEIRQTIKDITACGGKAVYLACDILDKKDLAEKVTAAEQQLGKVTGIVHGAGNLADKKIDRKTLVDFTMVFGTKVKGLENLLEVIPASQLKTLCLFSSVSGYFGNAGQVDYAAANEVLNKLAYQFKSQHPRVQVKSIDWGPWDSGMVNAALKKAYQERGVAIIPVDTGAQIFAREYSNQSDVQIVVGSANYARSGKWVRSEATPRSYIRDLAQAANPFLKSHVIGGSPVLPATCALGWLIDCARNYAPNFAVQKITGFSVLKGVVLDGKQSEHFTASVAPASDVSFDAKSPTLSVVITSTNQGKTVQHYSADVQLQDAQAELDLGRLAIDLSQEADLGERALYSASGEPAWLFHGPAFAGLKKIHKVTATEIVASGELQRLSDAEYGQFSPRRFNGYLADVLLQAPYLWVLLNTDGAGLPLGVESIEIAKPLAFDQKVLLRATIVESSNSRLLANIEVADFTGEVFIKLTGVQFTCSKKIRSKVLHNDTVQTEV
ncbi:SDR family NAD(P)-dependent oxidoreductase [Halioxenophilus aromaticivorans]|uniref:Type I polyketide synthase n=1 Tax=Halioxenophilus aromaticivorans TaxID=1306992 RepID=A0AAV3U5Q9_9ALTE